jgi:hypothetical protein
MKHLILVFIVTVFIMLSLGAVFFVSRIHESVPGATDIPLIARCELIYFDTRLQPVNTLVLGCPRMDMFRLWPLPIQHPWFEDPWYDNPDALNG